MLIAPAFVKLSEWQRMNEQKPILTFCDVEKIEIPPETLKNGLVLQFWNEQWKMLIAPVGFMYVNGVFSTLFTSQFASLFSFDT